MNISRLSAKIANTALGLCDLCTSESPSPLGIASILGGMQQLDATDDGPAPTGGSHRHHAQDAEGVGRRVPDESAVSK
jgi:hypothetical protein